MITKIRAKTCHSTFDVGAQIKDSERKICNNILLEHLFEYQTLGVCLYRREWGGGCYWVIYQDHPSGFNSELDTINTRGSY